MWQSIRSGQWAQRDFKLAQAEDIMPLTLGKLTNHMGVLLMLNCSLG